jgi:hypothetical protein
MVAAIWKAMSPAKLPGFFRFKITTLVVDAAALTEPPASRKPRAVLFRCRHGRNSFARTVNAAVP